MWDIETPWEGMETHVPDKKNFWSANWAFCINFFRFASHQSCRCLGCHWDSIYIVEWRRIMCKLGNYAILTNLAEAHTIHENWALHAGGSEAHAPGAWQQRCHHGHRPHRVLPQRRVRHFSKNFRGLNVKCDVIEFHLSTGCKTSIGRFFILFQAGVIFFFQVGYTGRAGHQECWALQSWDGREQTKVGGTLKVFLGAFHCTYLISWRHFVTFLLLWNIGSIGSTFSCFDTFDRRWTQKTTSCWRTSPSSWQCDGRRFSTR